MKKLIKSNWLYFFAFQLLTIQWVTGQAVDLTGAWNGAIKIPGMNLAITLEFQKEGQTWKGNLAIPVQRIEAMNLADLIVDGPKIAFKLPEVPGNASFAGSVKVDSNVITGNYTQGGATFVLEVKRASAADQAKLMAKIDRIKALADSAIIKAKVPGLGFGIVKDGNILLAEGFGYKNIETKEKVGPNTLFAIGSASKAFTTMGLALLEDEGVLDWEKPIKTYLPEFAMYDRFASEEMNAVDLVCHRSGLPRHDFLWYGSSLSRMELLKRIKYLPPSAPFRTKFQYQNLMYMTAGVLTERLGGKTWESYIGNHIFRPLGMEASNFSVNRMQESADYSMPHQEIEDKVEKIPFRNIDAIGPAGSINSTVNDMLKWVQLHLNDGKVGDQQIVSSANLKKMHRPHKVIENFPVANFPQFSNLSYGLGWFIYNYGGTQVVQHGGNIDGFSALVYLLPEENIGMVLLTNLNGNGVATVLANYATDILLDKEAVDWFTMVYGQKPKKEKADDKTEEENRVAGTKPSHALSDFAGAYEHPGYGRVTVVEKAGQLRFQYNSFDLPLTHWHYDVFKGKDEMLGLELPLHFQMDSDGAIIKVEIPLEATLEPMVFLKKAPEQLTNPEFLAKLTGAYDGAGQSIKVALQGNKLTMSLVGQPTYELIPQKDTTFKLKGLNGFTVAFEMEKDKVKALIFNQPNGVFKATPKE